MSKNIYKYKIRYTNFLNCIVTNNMRTQDELNAQL